jgi:transcriptional regulator with XRE-family HTH domain
MSIHIGNIIASRLEAVGMSKSEFARRINKARQNINDILNRTSMDTELLFNISKALNYDFFQHYVVALNEESRISEPHSEYGQMNQQLHDCEKRALTLEKDLLYYKNEGELLKQIVELLKKNSN